MSNLTNVFVLLSSIIVIPFVIIGIIIISILSIGLIIVAIISSLGLIAFPILLLESLYACNEIVSGKILQITNNDAFLCNVDIEYKWNITFYNIQCNLLQLCHKNCNLSTHNFTSCENVPECDIHLTYNHFYEEKSSCFRIVFEKNDIPIHNYKTPLIGMMIILTCWASVFLMSIITCNYDKICNMFYNIQSRIYNKNQYKSLKEQYLEIV